MCYLIVALTVAIGFTWFIYNIENKQVYYCIELACQKHLCPNQFDYPLPFKIMVQWYKWNSPASGLFFCCCCCF